MRESIIVPRIEEGTTSKLFIKEKYICIYTRSLSIRKKEIKNFYYFSER